MSWLRVLRLMILMTMLCSVARAQLVIEEIPRGMYYARTARVKKFKDMKNMRDVFHYDGLLMGRNKLSGSIANNFGRIIINKDGKDRGYFRSAMSYFVRYRFFEEYSVNMIFMHDLNREAVAAWSPNFNYAIGRFQWRPNKFNYGYENYQPIRFNDENQKFYNKFLQGYYFVSYSHLLPDSLRKKLAIDSTFNIKFIYFVRYYLYYPGANNQMHGGTLRGGKPIFGMAIRYSIWRNFYIEGSLNRYGKKETQMPWDPDFTYGFGYTDYRAFRVSATYANYGANRFPWNREDAIKHSFIDGNFKVSFNWMW